ncbi:hypothetical protein AAEX28_15065 [Lentisphaerota bacterium WC36G]|nr:hypothetical protein LJT99_01820 [Lentisphaerae bacterium WC36]
MNDNHSKLVNSNIQEKLNDFTANNKNMRDFILEIFDQEIKGSARYKNTYKSLIEKYSEQEGVK